ncbi:MAG: FAD-binding protein [Thermoplasmatota archaeon]
MALTKHDIEQLMARVGRDNVLTSEADRLVYSTDVGSPPAIVDLLVNRKADAIVRCRSHDDVLAAIQFARKRNIPLTPRAAATSALGGAVPKRAGIVLDLTCLNKRVEIDEAAATVLVDAGVVIADLQAKLNDVGLELPCYPTSGLAATIGGFVATDGHGIHATRAGNIGKHVLEIEGVGGDGRAFRVRSRDELDYFLGLGGSTGVITSIRLKVLEATADKPVVLVTKHYKDIQAAAEEVRRRFAPKHIMLRNDTFTALRCEATATRKNPTGGRHALLLCFNEAQHGAIASDLELLATRCGGQLLDDKAAAKEWDERFYPIKAKRLGPSIVAGEVFVPADKVAAYLKRLHAKVAVAELAVEGHWTDDGRVYFFIYTLDDERRPNYPLGWGTSAWILSTAKKFGGTAYQSGVWLQWESKSLFGATRYKKLKDFKSQTDARNLLNPGMVFPLPAPIPEFVHRAKVAGPTPAPSLGFQLAAGNPMLQMAGGMFKYRRHKTVGVKAADVAADMARGEGNLGLHTDLIWGADLPSLQAIPNPGNLPMTQTVRGKMALAKAYVTGKVTDPWILKEALDVADPEPEEATVAPEYGEVKEAIDALRRAVAGEGVELDVQAVEIVEEVVETATDAGAAAGGAAGGLDIEAIKEQAKNTPEAEKAWVLAADCIVCNGCESACPTDAAIVTDTARVDRDLCIADGGCFDACPTGAIRPGEEDKATSAGWPEGSRLAGQFGV